MSTRAQIVVMRDETTMYDVKIYKHGDGYPDGVLPTLEPFAKAFAADRGKDPEYMVPQIIRRFAIDDAVEHAKRIADNPSEARWYEPTKSFTGWGLSTYWHGDIEYLYKVFPDGRVEAHSVNVIPDDLPDSVFPSTKLVSVRA